MIKLFASVALLLCILLVYQETYENSFHLDDYQNIVYVDALHLKELSATALSAAADGALLKGRIIPNITFAIDWWRGGGKAAAFLQTNVIIHAITAIMLFHLLLLILHQHLTSKRQLYITCFVVSLIWAVHPIQIQSVSYIVQRMTSLSALFVLTTLYCYIQARRDRSHLQRYVWLCFSAIAAVCGVMSKENAWIVLALILMVEYGVIRSAENLIRNRFDVLLLLLPVLLLLYIIIDLASQSGPLYSYFNTGYESRDFTMAERLLTQPKVIVFYLSQYVWPMPWRFSIEHDFAVSQGGMADISAWLAIAALGLWLTTAARLFFRKQRLTAMFMLWIPVTLSIESSFIPLEMIFEHRMYLPSVGIAGLLAIGLVKVWSKGDNAILAASSAVVTVTLLLGLISYDRVKAWHTPLSLYVDALNNAPQSPRLWGNIGRHYILNGDKKKGIEAMEKGLSYQPDFVPLLVNYAMFESSEGRRQHALELVSRAIRSDQTLHMPYVVRGRIYTEIGRYANALADYNAAIRLKPDSDRVYAYRGELLYKEGKLTQAITDFTQAVKLAPSTGSHYWNLAHAQERAGFSSEAVNNYKTACGLSNELACQHLETVR